MLTSRDCARRMQYRGHCEGEIDTDHKGSVADIRKDVATFKEFTEIAGLPAVQELENRYGLPEDQRAEL